MTATVPTDTPSVAPSWLAMTVDGTEIPAVDVRGRPGRGEVEGVLAEARVMVPGRGPVMAGTLGSSRSQSTLRCAVEYPERLAMGTVEVPRIQRPW
jgi:hypothetical protein